MDPEEAAWLRHTYFERISPDLFEPAAPATEQPVLVLLGGQPGAGKTVAQHWLVREHHSHEIVPIIGDDFRRFHPAYRQTLTEDPLAMPHVTAAAAGTWTGMAVHQALTQRYSLLIEGTWRNPALVENTIAQAFTSGYRIHAAVVATPPLYSLLGTLARYYQASANHTPARWTPIEAHQQALTALPHSIEQIAANPKVERFTILTRAGERPFDQHQPIRPAQASAIYRTHVGRHLEPAEINTITLQAARLYQQHQATTANHPDARRAWNVLTEQLAITTSQPDALATAIERLHHLNHNSPTPRTETPDPHRWNEWPQPPDTETPTHELT